MENNYKFRFDTGEPSSDDIRQRMDFDALMGKFEEVQQQRRGHLRVRYVAYVLAAAAAAVALLLLVPGWLRPKALTPEEWFGNQPFVQAPLPNMQPDFETAMLADAYQGGVIEYPSGSRIVIPASAFMTERGQRITGEVTIHYRELHDHIDFFTAGIPMNYDSAGTQRYLAAAGMVEVYAVQNGQRLRMADGKVMQVELISTVAVNDYFTLPKYNVYQLDTVARTWTYRSIDMVQFVEDESWITADDKAPQFIWQQALASLELEYNQALQELQLDYPLPSAPFMPTRAAGNRPTLELNFGGEELALDPASDLQPEDLEYLHKGTIWEVAPESPAVDSRAFQVAWESVRLRRLNNQRYELTLQHSRNKEVLIVSPVLMGDAYQRAVNSYEMEKAAYDAAVAKREAMIKGKRDTLQVQFAERKLALQRDLDQDMQSRPGSLTRKVVNRFVVSAFGVWSCAQSVAPPQSVTGVRYMDNQGNALAPTTVYVANPTQNTVFRYLATEDAPIGLAPGVDNLLWTVGASGDISIATLQPLPDQPAEIVMAKVAPPVDTAQGLRGVLRLE